MTYVRVSDLRTPCKDHPDLWSRLSEKSEAEGTAPQRRSPGRREEEEEEKSLIKPKDPRDGALPGHAALQKIMKIKSEFTL